MVTDERPRNDSNAPRSSRYQKHYHFLPKNIYEKVITNFKEQIHVKVKIKYIFLCVMMMKRFLYLIRGSMMHSDLHVRDFAVLFNPNYCHRISFCSPGYNSRYL